MNFWILFFSSIFLMLLFTPNLVISDNVPASVCTLDDIRHQLKIQCRKLMMPLKDLKAPPTRRRRHYTKHHFSLEEGEPKYIFQVKRSGVQVICCTPSPMKKRGANCLELYIY